MEKYDPCKTPRELELERKGDIYALQQHRREYHLQIKYDFNINLPVAKFLGAEYNLRATVQREIALKEELAGCSGYSKYRKRTKIERQLRDLDKEYWLFARKRWQGLSALPIGPLTRGLDLWRSHPRWYMHQYLVQDCIGKGGCCARDCGCCLNRPVDLEQRKLGVGHCTVECGCCTKSRGFGLTSAEKQDFKTQFDRNPYTFYVRQINPVLIWGLLKGEDTNPFDMIYEPSEGEDRSPGEKHKSCKAVSGNVLALGNSLPPYEDPPYEESSGTEVSTGDIISVDDE